jgi:hypothetical protein
MTEEQLFGRFELLPKRIKEMNEFKERHRLHAAKYISENLKNKSDYEILQAIGNTPASVLNSEEYKAKISHLTFKERSSIVLKSTISEVLTELKKTPGGRKQYKLVLAALSHPVYGPPELDMAIHTRDIKKAKETRTQLFEGREPILKVEENKKRQIYPKEVEDMGRQHWLENTIPEPAKLRGKVVEEGGEVVAKRYQDRTNSEMYSNFKDEYSESVRKAMKTKKRKLLEKLENRPENNDKQHRTQYANTLPEQFPSFTWYVKLRPEETVPMCDHTTGLCRYCESAKLNHAEYVKALKQNCNCGTKSCPNWFCTCMPDGDESDCGDDQSCSCSPVCACPQCLSCQVL